MLKKIILIIGLNFIFSNLASANLEVAARTAILQDYLSGEILYEKEPDHLIHPASMTKIMTAIVAFDLIKSGNLKLEDKFMVSENNL